MKNKWKKLIPLIIVIVIITIVAVVKGGNDTVKPAVEQTEPEKEVTVSESILDGYWQCRLYDFALLKFEKDGTGKFYSTESFDGTEENYTLKDLDVSDFTYSLKGEDLTIDFGDVKQECRGTTSTECPDIVRTYMMDSYCRNDDELFFYDRNIEELVENNHMEKAFWINRYYRDIDENTRLYISSEPLIDYLKTKTDDSINRGYQVMDMNDDGVDEVIEVGKTEKDGIRILSTDGVNVSVFEIPSGNGEYTGYNNRIFYYDGKEEKVCRVGIGQFKIIEKGAGDFNHERAEKLIKESDVLMSLDEVTGYLNYW